MENSESEKDFNLPARAETTLIENLSIKNSSSDIERSWDDFSLTYFQFINECTLSLMNNLSALSRIRSNNKKKILDAGCGPGLGTKLLSTLIPNLDSTIYAFDLSGEMIRLSNQVFSEHDDFNSNENNHWEVKTYPDTDCKINIDVDMETIRLKKKGKIINFFRGNVERLIFEDEQFDAYVSNLCFMLCRDPDTAIKEAYRVLKFGGTASISIWGKKEDTKLAFVLINQVFAKHGHTPPAGSKSSFDLAKDPEELKLKFLNAGFKDVRFEYVNAIFDCFDEEEYMMRFQGPQVKSLCKNIEDFKVKEILDEVKDRAREELAKGILPVLNCLIISARK